MGKHEWRHLKKGATDVNGGRGWRDLLPAPDPEQRELVEPDRGMADKVSEGEREMRDGVHTDRDPAEDIQLASSRPQQNQYE